MDNYCSINLKVIINLFSFNSTSMYRAILKPNRKIILKLENWLMTYMKLLTKLNKVGNKY